MDKRFIFFFEEKRYQVPIKKKGTRFLLFLFVDKRFIFFFEEKRYQVPIKKKGTRFLLFLIVKIQAVFIEKIKEINGILFAVY